MTDGDGGDGGSLGGDWGDGGTPGIFGDSAGGAGVLFAGAAAGGLANLVPDTPASLRKQLTDYKQMLDDGLITQADYDQLKARALGI